MSSSILTQSSFYRNLHSGNAGDEDFYRKACGLGSAEQRVLELGAGWGRLTEALLRAGLRVVALEREPEFLSSLEELARRYPAQLEPFAADLLQRLPEGPFARVLLPYNLAYALGGLAPVLSVLERLRPLLEAEGEVWLDFYPMEDFDQAAQDGLFDTEEAAEFEALAELQVAGQALRIEEKTELTLPSRQLTVSYRALNTQGTICAEQTLLHHYFLLPELLEGAERLGYELAGLFSSFVPEAELPAEDTASAEEEEDTHHILCLSWAGSPGAEGVE